MTLKADKTGHKVKSVTIDGTEYCYFGDNYVHLPETNGNAVIEVHLTSQEDYVPHVSYVNPSAVIESAQYADQKLQLTLSGEFDVTAYIVGSSKVFRVGRTRIFDNNTAHLQIDVSSQTRTGQVELSLIPSSGSVEATVDAWEVSDTDYRSWRERADSPGIDIEHNIGDLERNSYYVVTVDGCPVDTCISDGLGEISFTSCDGCTTKLIEVLADTTCFAGVSPRDRTEDDQRITALFVESYLNPSAPRTVISYGLPRPSRVILSIYSVDGCLTRTLAEGFQSSGTHSASWDGLDVQGNPVSPGVYFCQLESSVGVGTCKIVLLR